MAARLIIMEKKYNDLKSCFSLIKNIREMTGNANNVNMAGSQRISKMAPTTANRYMFTAFPIHQYSDTRIVRTNTVLAFLEFLYGFEFSFVKPELIGENGIAGFERVAWPDVNGLRLNKPNPKTLNLKPLTTSLSRLNHPHMLCVFEKLGCENEFVQSGVF